jgi:hypothetical protein
LQMQAVTARVMSIDGCYNGAHKVRLGKGPAAATAGPHPPAFNAVVNIMNEFRQLAAHYAGGGGLAELFDNLRQFYLRHLIFNVPVRARVTSLPCTHCHVLTDMYSLTYSQTCTH